MFFSNLDCDRRLISLPFLFKKPELQKSLILHHSAIQSTGENFDTAKFLRISP